MSTDAVAPAAPLSVEEFRKRRAAPRNVVKEVKQNLSPLDKLAVWITTWVGTMGFFFIIFGWTVIWLAWNTLLPASWRFDPAMGFVLYLFLCNVIQILLMPLIMVGQNVQGAQSEARAQHDLEVNVKAEDEIEIILQHLEYQNNALLTMMQKLGCNMPNETATPAKAATSKATRAKTATPKATAAKAAPARSRASKPSAKKP